MLERVPALNHQTQSATKLEHIPLSKNPLDLYLLSCKVEGLSKETIENYSRKLRKFLAFLNDEPLTSMAIRSFLVALQEDNLISTSVNAYYRVICSYANWLHSEGMIDKNPINNIRPPRMKKNLPSVFNSEDIARLLKATEGNKLIALRNRAMVLLLLDTGLRLGELAAISLPDCDLNSEHIKVMGKGGKERYVPLGGRTQKALLKYLLIRKDEYSTLWVTEENTPLSKRGCQIAIKRLCRIANITDARPSPHTFRHTAAVTYLRNGGDVRTLQLMLGHSTLNMTMRYLSCLNNDDVQRVHKKASPVDNLRF